MAKPVTNLDFEEFSGTWSVAEAEAEAFDAVLADIRRVDPCRVGNGLDPCGIGARDKLKHVLQLLLEMHRTVIAGHFQIA